MWALKVTRVVRDEGGYDVQLGNGSVAGRIEAEQLLVATAVGRTRRGSAWKPPGS